MTDKPPAVVMTVSGDAKSHRAGPDIREILEQIYTEYQTAGSDWDRPDRLYIRILEGN